MDVGPPETVLQDRADMQVRRLKAPSIARKTIACFRWLRFNHRSGSVFLALMLGSLDLAGVGVPPTRFYSLAEMGGVQAGFRIGFDEIGRISVTRYNRYLVLNDREWINLLEPGHEIDHAVVQIVSDRNGSRFFTSHGHWGLLERSDHGKFSPRSLSPSDRPDWTLANQFDQIHVVDGGGGLVFHYWGGFVYLDLATGQHSYRRVGGLDHVFSFGGSLYASLGSGVLLRFGIHPSGIDETGTEVAGVKSGFQVVAIRDAGSVLLADPLSGLFFFDGSRMDRWETDLDSLENGNLSALCLLFEGYTAVAVRDQGIFLLSEEGKVMTAFTGPQYEQVKEIVSNEEGVFWFSTDAGLGKVVYGSSVKTIDQGSGVDVNWPEVLQWNHNYYLVNGGSVYVSKVDPITGSCLFELLAQQPNHHNLTVAGASGHLLVGSHHGVFAIKDNQSMEHVLRDIAVARIVPIHDTLCLVLGSTQHTAIRWDEGRWVECADRVEGHGFPSVVHRVRESVWIELGVNRVSRISWKGDRLSSELFKDFPWEKPTWVNIGVIGDVALLCGRGDQRIYFNERSGKFESNPHLDAILGLSPFGVWRTVMDRHESIWVSHKNGLSLLKKENGHYSLALGSVRFMREPTPIIRLMDGDQLWVVSHKTLHAVDSSIEIGREPRLQPQIESVFDSRTGNQLSHGQAEAIGPLDYSQNSLMFRFFSGSYAHEGVLYKVEVKRSGLLWMEGETESQMVITNLREGEYELTLRLLDMGVAVGEPAVFRFGVMPPWHRTHWAYGIFAVVLCMIIAGAVSLPTAYIRNRNRMLSDLVKDRTRELENTMEKLKTEERNAVVVEERHRIANEIHDSVQQGLSSLRLLLDSTLGMQALPVAVKQHLNAANKVLSFTHQELKHAVWNLETPLLRDGDLPSALGELVSFFDLHSTVVSVDTQGATRILPNDTHHHLIRIVQEAISNAVRHGKAKAIAIQLQYQSDRLELAILDDGCGFDALTAWNEPNHLGLRGLMERARCFGGKVELFSEIGHGTRINIAVPYEIRD
jgi:signal transduction histidine kinase